MTTERREHVQKVFSGIGALKQFMHKWHILKYSSDMTHLTSWVKG